MDGRARVAVQLVKGQGLAVEGPEGPNVEWKNQKGLLYFTVTGVHKMDWGNRCFPPRTALICNT